MPVARRRAVVVARHRRETIVEDEFGNCRPALIKGRSLKPLVGDEVLVEDEADGTAVVLEITDRRSVLERIDKRGRREGVAANVSLIAVVVAPQPSVDWQLVDRYLVAAALMGSDAAVIRNKLDLSDAELEAGTHRYRDIGYPVVYTSAREGLGMNALRDLFKPYLSVLVGQSGVGKSSIINRLLESRVQAVGTLSQRRPLGRHTTTAARLYRLPGNGGRLIDSPGVRRYAPGISSALDLGHGFIEFRPYLASCRFGDCRHLDEPGCAVTAAVGAGRIHRERYRSFRTMSEALANVRPGRQ